MSKVVYEIHKMKSPELPFIFHTDTVKTLTNVPNWHDNIELLCFLDGEGTIRIDDKEYEVGRGNVAIINPAHIHSTASKTSIIYHCLIIDNSYCLDNGINVGDIEFSEMISDAAIFDSFQKVARDFSLIQNGCDAITTLPSLRYNILGILLRLCEQHVYSQNKRSTENDHSYDTVKEIIRYLKKAHDPINLDSIAEHMKISKSHMSREFKRITGTTIITYFNMFRCEKAKRMIYNGTKVNEAALAVGFDNLSYFSRTFKRYMGILPSECQKKQS